MSQPLADTVTTLLGIDHLAIRASYPDELARFLCDHCEMERTDSPEGFGVVAVPGGRTRLFLLQAEETPNPGVLERLVLRVSDLDASIARLPDRYEVDRPAPDLAVFKAAEGLVLGFTSVLGGGVDYDVDHVVLSVMDPDETTLALAELGFVPSGGALHVADKHLRVQAGMRSSGDNELLSHIGVLVKSVEALKGQALRGGLQFDELTLAPNKLGVYVRGAERLRVEYSEPS